MSRYIDVDALEKEGWFLSRNYCTQNTCVYETRKLSDIPTADVVEVVRCKNCKWYDLTDPCGTLTPNAHRCKRVTRLWFEDDAYCSYGERRE